MKFEIIVPTNILNDKIVNNFEEIKDRDIKKTYICNFNQTSIDNINVLTTKKNNISHKRNIAIKNSNAEYLIFLDSDIKIDLSYIIHLNEILNQNKDIFVFGGPNINTIRDDFLVHQISKSYKSFFIGGFNNFVKNLNSKDQFVDFLPSCNLIINNNFLKKNNFYFNENLPTGEDHDLCNKIRLKNFKILFCNKLSVKHITKDFKSFLFERYYYGKSILLMFNTKNYKCGLSLLLVLLFFIFNVFIATITIHTLDYRFLSFYLIIYFLYFLENFFTKKDLSFFQPLFNYFVSLIPAIGSILSFLPNRHKYYKNYYDNENY